MEYKAVGFVLVLRSHWYHQLLEATQASIFRRSQGKGWLVSGLNRFSLY
jgi:hypothetical protein